MSTSTIVDYYFRSLEVLSALADCISGIQELLSTGILPPNTLGEVFSQDNIKKFDIF